MGKRTLLAATLVLTFVIVGCTRKKGVEPVQPEELLPLSETRCWVYRSYSLDPATGDTLSQHRFEMAVKGKMLIGGKEYALLGDGVARNDEDGLFVAAYDASTSRFYDALFFRYPVPDDTLSYTFQDPETGESVPVAVGKGEVTVPAGTFPDCLRYWVTRGKTRSLFAFAPGLALVEVRDYDQPGQGMVLEAYCKGAVP